MTRDYRLLGRLLAIVGFLMLPAAAGAQELYTYTLGVFGGIGGSFDADPGDSFSNTGFQLNFSVVTEPRSHLGFRVGKLSLDGDEFFGSLSDAEMTYVTVGGEYRGRQGFWESGMYLALGGYRLEGTGLFGDEEEETTWGLAVGVTGELPLTRRLGLQGEISGHYVDFDEAQFFAMAHAGLTLHF